MKKIIMTMAIIMTLGASLFAQSPLTTFEWRVENESLTSANVYQCDIYLYNTSASPLELLSGNVSLYVNTAWRNGGTITPTVVTTSSDLIPLQQPGTAGYTNGATVDFVRRTITSKAVGSGTTIAAGGRAKWYTFVFTNTVNFSTTATPNFAFKFTTGNPATFGYTNTLTSLTAVAVSNTVNTSNWAKCFGASYWNGSSWNIGSRVGTSPTTVVPSDTNDAIIYNGTLGAGALTCRSYDLRTGATHNLGANALTVKYNMVNNGTLNGATGTLNLVGTTATQTANQTVSGSGSFTVANLGFGVAANGGTKTLSAGISVSSAVTQSGTATLAAGGNLTLLSNASGTARINQLTSGAAITGNIKVERYIPTPLGVGSNGRRWRFLSSPVVGGSTLQWRDNGGNTAGRGILVTGGAPSAGYDSSISFNPSIYSYNESSNNGGGNINAKWEQVNGNTTLTNGLGYRVYVRGDRSISLTTVQTVANPTTIWVSGTYPSTPANMPVTYSAGLGNGWNLVGNPFACPIDWSASPGWTKTNVGGTIWIFNPITNSYGSFDGSTTINSVTRHIGSGQAFFVQTNGAAPVLSADETVKVSNTPSDLFKTAEMNSLRIRLVKDTLESDETVIRFMENKSDEFSATDDVVKYAMNQNVNISSYFGPDKYAMVNYLKSQNIKTKVVPLSAWVSKVGSYEMQFTQVEDFDANINIYLKDNYTNTLTDLRIKNKYMFDVDSLAASTADGRLEVVFVNTNTSVEEGLASLTPSMNVYPNPAVDVLNVELFNTNFKHSNITIYNVSGQEVMNSTMTGKNKTLDIQKLSNGVYLIKLSNSETGYSNTVKFVK